MKKIYFIVPIVAAVVFFFFYSTVKNDLKQRDEDRKAQVLKDQAARAANDVEIRKKAFELAFAEANRKIAQIAAKEAEKAQQAAEVQAAKDARDLVYRERERQYKRYMELIDSRTVANEQLAVVKQQLTLQNAQASSIRATVQEAVQNKTTYEQVLNKMEAAEKQILAQQAAERAVKKS